MFKIIFFLMNALDGSRLLNLVNSKWGGALCAIVLGVLLSCALAPFEIWPTAILAYSFLMMLLSVAKSKKKVFFTTLLFYASYATVSLTWLNFVMEGFGELPSVLSNFVIVLFSFLYIALPYAILNTLAFYLSKGKTAVFLISFMPVAFILSDFFTGWFLTGFPWLYPGYSCVEGPLKNFAPFIGVRGISALVYIMSGAIALTALRRFLFLPIAAVILLLGIFLEGVSFVTPLKAVDVTMVQGNIEQQVRNDGSRTNEVVATYWDLTKDKIRKDRLIIWPESALPFALEYGTSLVEELNNAFKEKDSALITGILSTPDAGIHAYNSIIALGETSDVLSITPYNKRELVPFGEIVPFADLLRPLGSIFVIPNSSFSYGDKVQEPIKVKGLEFTPAICYEAIFPETVKAMDSDNTNAIVMLSNDSWFGPTKAPVQHLNIARMRSLELQKPMLRDTNSGITAYIDEFGKIQKVMPTDVASSIDFTFTPVSGQTLYSKIGNYGLLGIIVLLILFGIYGNVRKPDKLKEQMNKLIRP